MGSTKWGGVNKGRSVVSMQHISHVPFSHYRNHIFPFDSGHSTIHFYCKEQKYVQHKSLYTNQSAVYQYAVWPSYLTKH